MLSVAKASNPLELKLLKETSLAEVQARAFRTALPKQAPLSRLLYRLQTFTSGNWQRATESLMQKQPAQSPTAAPLIDPRKQVGLRLWGPTRPDPMLTDQHRASPAKTSATDALSSSRPVISKGPVQQMQEPMDEDLMPAIQRILNHRLSAKEGLNPAHLRQAFEQSGLLLETRLAAGQQPVNDLKASLLHLLFQLRTRLGMTPGADREAILRPDSGQQPEITRQLADLLSQTESSLARILVNQLRSAVTDEGLKQIWHFELPIHQMDDSDSFRLQIGREAGNRNGQKETIWSVRLNFDLAPLGPVSSHLTLSGDEISSHFTAARRDSAKLLEQAMPQLNEAFVRAGLKVGKLTACEGEIEGEEASLVSPAPLLDERA